MTMFCKAPICVQGLSIFGHRGPTLCATYYPIFCNFAKQYINLYHIKMATIPFLQVGRNTKKKNPDSEALKSSVLKLHWMCRESSTVCYHVLCIKTSKHRKGCTGLPVSL